MAKETLAVQTELMPNSLSIISQLLKPFFAIFEDKLKRVRIKERYNRSKANLSSLIKTIAATIKITYSYLVN